MMTPATPNPTKKSAPRPREALFTTNNQKHTSDHAESKAFTTLQAKFSRVGHTLYRTVNPDGTILYLAGKWGYLRELKGLKAVAVFLAVIGG